MNERGVAGWASKAKKKRVRESERERQKGSAGNEEEAVEFKAQDQAGRKSKSRKSKPGTDDDERGGAIESNKATNGKQ